MPILITTSAITYTYKIFNSAGVQMPTGNQNNPTDGVPEGNYTVQIVEQGSGCIVSSPQTAIQQNPKIDLTLAGGNPCILPFDVTATSSTTFPYTWYIDNVLQPTENSSVLSDNTSGPGTHTYFARVKGAADGSTCDNYFAIAAVLRLPIDPAITQSDQCDDQVILSAEPVGTFVYQWTNDLGDPPLGGQKIQVDLSKNGAQYTVNVQNTQNGCTVPSPPITVNVLGKFTVSLTFPAQPCYGTPFDITATINQTPDGDDTYQWQLNGSNISGGNNATLNVTNSKAGVYKVIFNSPDCQATAEGPVTIAPLTSGNLPPSGVICPDPANADPLTKQILLNPGAGFRSYEWTENDDATVLSTDPTYTATEAGIFKVKLENQFSCFSTDQIILLQQCDPQLTGPNAFRPEGTNNEFFLYTFFITDESFEIFIYNRWGEMVFASSDRYFKWNGGYKNDANKPLTPGTYSYVVKYKSSYRPELGIQQQRGGVVLLR
jgi:hypothetical protein